MKIINESKEKFKGMADELCGLLFDMLHEINVLEHEISLRYTSIKEKIPHLTPEQISTEFDEMWSDLHKGYEHIVLKKCTPRLLEKPYGMKFDEFITYRWVEDDFEDCTAIFKMTAPKKAVIEVHYKIGTLDMADRFILIKSD